MSREDRQIEKLKGLTLAPQLGFCIGCPFMVVQKAAHISSPYGNGLPHKSQCVTWLLAQLKD